MRLAKSPNAVGKSGKRSFVGLERRRGARDATGEEGEKAEGKREEKLKNGAE